MRILGIETTGPYCSAALADGGSVIERKGKEQLSHLSGLTGMIAGLLDEAQISLGELDYIAVSTGPGSYTGIRIGVTTARALSQASGVPLIAVPTIPAFGFSEKEKLQEGKTVCPIFNARRRQVYAGAYKGESETVKAGPYMLDEFISLLDAKEALFFVGDGVTAYREQIEKICAGMDYEVDERTQGALGVCGMAQAMLAGGDAYSGMIGLSAEEVSPQYMRMAEAEKNLREGKLGKKGAK